MASFLIGFVLFAFFLGFAIAVIGLIINNRDCENNKIVNIQEYRNKKRGMGSNLIDIDNELAKYTRKKAMAELKKYKPV